MKQVEITMKAHKQIAKLSKHDMRGIYEALAKLEH
jgi:mRNA-degrading endonuclease RelE of RelBE toxin-antitoxin system